MAIDIPKMLLGGVLEIIGLYSLQVSPQFAGFLIGAGAIVVVWGFTGFWLGSIPKSGLGPEWGLGFDPSVVKKR